MGPFEARIDAADSLAQAGHWAEAAERYASLVAEGGATYRLHLNYGVALLRCGRYLEGRDQLGTALRYQPKAPEVIDNLVDAHLVLGDPIAAEALCRGLLLDAPDHHPAWNNLGVALTNQGRIPEGVEALQRSLELMPDDPVARGNLLLSLNFMATDGAGLAEVHRLACEDQPSAPPKPLPAVAGRRIRIGYVSCDFRSHPVAFFIAGVIGTHDRSAFEVFCYSTNQGSDWMTKNLARMAEHFVNLSACSDLDAARRIEADQIDILVDLGGHTQGSRLGLFAHRPAPVQVTYLGYPATTGCPFIDYRMVDALTDPEGAEDHATEQLVRLPEPFICYQPHPDCPNVGPLPALANGHITFGSFNAAPKISDDTLDLWSRVLSQMPTSRLLIKSKHFSNGIVCAGFRERFAQRGIDPARLTLAGHIPNALHHLAAYGDIDIALDTFPYHGTTTTCEALWMGVPVISLIGDLHAARVGYTLLSAVHLEGLATFSTDEFVSMAVDFASDVTALATLRSQLRQVVAGSPLCDRFRLTRGIEGAYRRMLAAGA